MKLNCSGELTVIRLNVCISTWLGSWLLLFEMSCLKYQFYFLSLFSGITPIYMFALGLKTVNGYSSQFQRMKQNTTVTRES